MKVVLSRNAERDLEEIGDWIAQDSPGRAVSFVAELREACRALGSNSRGHPLVDQARDPMLRRKVFGNYLIFYDVGADAVEILHILHGARDYAQIIFPGEPE
ncbi:MAG: type II toxin-antitoxin system RelE/ParE family toxin [Proteobacteria bacterium]|nr:type II toxin-antitoxin system RelE/ParE family toxin [Pseudomonadota bacterium]